MHVATYICTECCTSLSNDHCLKKHVSLSPHENGAGCSVIRRHGSDIYLHTCLPVSLVWEGGAADVVKSLLKVEDNSTQYTWMSAMQNSNRTSEMGSHVSVRWLISVALRSCFGLPPQGYSPVPSQSTHPHDSPSCS